MPQTHSFMLTFDVRLSAFPQMRWHLIYQSVGRFYAFKIVCFVFPHTTTTMADTVAAVTEVNAVASNGAVAASPAAKKPAKAKAVSSAAAKKPRVKPTHPPIAEMVYTGIKSLKERSGSSLQAIKKYVATTYKVDVDKLAPFIKKYLRNAVTSGQIVQTKGKGASGSFKLAAKEVKEKKTVVAKKPKAPKAKATTKVAEKKPKAVKKPAAAGATKKKTATSAAVAAKKKPATVAADKKKATTAADKKKAATATAKSAAKAKTSVKSAKASPKQKPTKATKAVASKPKTPKPKKTVAAKKTATAKKTVVSKKK